MQNTVAATNGVGRWVKLHPRVLFWFLEHTNWLLREVWIFAQCTQKCVLVVSAFLWVSLPTGLNLPHFTRKFFFNGLIKAYYFE